MPRCGRSTSSARRTSRVVRGRQGVRRMVYVSSIHALSRPPRGTSHRRSAFTFDPHNAAGEYDQTKAEASLAVLAEVEKGLDAVIICPTGIIGPYHYRGGSPMSSQMRKWIRPGWHLTINGHFDFVDVRDVARGMILAAEKGRKGETYILRGERVSVAAADENGALGDRRKGVDLLVPFSACPVCLRLCDAPFAVVENPRAVHPLCAGDPCEQLRNLRGESGPRARATRPGRCGTPSPTPSAGSPKTPNSQCRLRRPRSRRPPDRRRARRAAAAPDRRGHGRLQRDRRRHRGEACRNRLPRLPCCAQQGEAGKPRSCHQGLRAASRR